MAIEEIKAIPTHYAGHTFRSRTEARWAVFFDQIGLRWEYEPEGVVLPDGTWYLPDFWMPDMELWVEVKPGGDVPDEAWEKAGALVDVTGYTLLMLNGAPWPQVYEIVFIDEPIEGPMPSPGGPVRYPVYWSDEYTGSRSQLHADDRPRVFWAGGGDDDDAEGAASQRIMAQAMEYARARKMDNADVGLPLGWEGVEPVV